MSVRVESRNVVVSIAADQQDKYTDKLESWGRPFTDKSQKKWFVKFLPLPHIVDDAGAEPDPSGLGDKPPRIPKVIPQEIFDEWIDTMQTTYGIRATYGCGIRGGRLMKEKDFMPRTVSQAELEYGELTAKYADYLRTLRTTGVDVTKQVLFMTDCMMNGPMSPVTENGKTITVEQWFRNWYDANR